MYMFLLPAGQTGDAWESFKQQCCVETEGALVRKVLSLLLLFLMLNHFNFENLCRSRGESRGGLKWWKGELVQPVTDSSVSHVKVTDSSVSHVKVTHSSVSHVKVTDSSVSHVKVTDSSFSHVNRRFLHRVFKKTFASVQLVVVLCSAFRLVTELQQTQQHAV